MTSNSGVTTFHDSTTLGVVQKASKEPVTPLIYPLADFTAKEMLTRPQKLLQITWNNAYVATRIPIPSNALLSLFTNYLTYFDFLKTSWKFQFRFNTTIFHQGSLMIGYLPYVNTTQWNDPPRHAVSMMNSTIVTAAGAKQVDYIVPYQIPYGAVKLAAGIEGEQAMLYVHSLTPFRASNGAPSQAIIEVWVSMQDPLVYGFRAQSDSTKTKTAVPTFFEKQIAKETAAKDENMFEKVLVTKGSEILRKTPYIGDIWNPIADFLNANVFSKPLVGKQVRPVNQYPFRALTTVDGGVGAEPISGQVMDILQPMEYPGFNGDRTVNEIAMMPSYFRTITFADTDVGITSNVNFHPRRMPVSTTGPYQGDFLSFTAAAFTLWRGSIRVGMLIASNGMSSGRIQLTYRTSGNFDLSSGNLVTQIVDFKGETWHYFTIPFIDRKYWRLCAPDPNNDPDLELLKTSINVTLLNYSPSDVSVTSYVDIAFFRAAGPDIQFSGLQDPQFDSEAQSRSLNDIFKVEKFEIMGGKSSTTNAGIHVPIIGVEYGMCNSEHPYTPQHLAKRPGRSDQDAPMWVGNAGATVWNEVNRIPMNYWSAIFRFWRGSINNYGLPGKIYSQRPPRVAAADNASPTYYQPTATSYSLYNVPYLKTIPFSGMWREVGAIEAQFNNPQPYIGAFGSFINQAAGDDMQFFHLSPPWIQPRPITLKKDTKTITGAYPVHKEDIPTRNNTY